MIRVLITPRSFTAGERERLEIRFTSTGGPCRDIVFTLGLPPGVSLIDGRERIEIAAIYPGRDFVHAVTVAAARTGDFTLTSPNFSYCDEDDMPVRVADWRAPISVGAPKRPVPPPVARPMPRLRVEARDEGVGLTAGEWGLLPVLVRNSSDVPVSHVAVTLDGPVEARGRRDRITLLPEGKVARFEFNVRPDGSGLLPVCVRVTFSYPNGLGSLRVATQEDWLNVHVARPGERAAATEPEAANGTTTAMTVLFLAASPKDLAPIRPDLELKRIQRELRLDQHRDDFRLLSELAANLDDVNRAIIAFKPGIVHFSGHGDEEGRLYVEDESGRGRPTNTEGMAELFGTYRDTIRCVIVNACYSRQLAEAVYQQHIDYAIGMDSEIGDNASIWFSTGFYQAFFGGLDVPTAFNSGRRLLRANQETTNEHRTPVIYPPGAG